MQRLCGHAQVEKPGIPEMYPSPGVVECGHLTCVRRSDILGLGIVAMCACHRRRAPDSARQSGRYAAGQGRQHVCPF